MLSNYCSTVTNKTLSVSGAIMRSINFLCEKRSDDCEVEEDLTFWYHTLNYIIEKLSVVFMNIICRKRRFPYFQENVNLAMWHIVINK